MLLSIRNQPKRSFMIYILTLIFLGTGKILILQKINFDKLILFFLGKPGIEILWLLLRLKFQVMLNYINSQSILD